MQNRLAIRSKPPPIMRGRALVEQHSVTGYGRVLQQQARQREICRWSWRPVAQQRTPEIRGGCEPRTFRPIAPSPRDAIKYLKHQSLAQHRREVAVAHCWAGGDTELRVGRRYWGMGACEADTQATSC